MSCKWSLSKDATYIANGARYIANNVPNLAQVSTNTGKKARVITRMLSLQRFLKSWERVPQTSDKCFGKMHISCKILSFAKGAKNFLRKHMPCKKVVFLLNYIVVLLKSFGEVFLQNVENHLFVSCEKLCGDCEKLHLSHDKVLWKSCVCVIYMCKVKVQTQNGAFMFFQVCLELPLISPQIRW